MKRIAKVLDIDGQFRERPDFPIAVVRERQESDNQKAVEGMIVDPIFNYSVYNNLYGRIITLVEATCETHKLQAVKDLFGKELREWEQYIYESARYLAEHGKSDGSYPTPPNIYTK